MPNIGVQLKNLKIIVLAAVVLLSGPAIANFAIFQTSTPSVSFTPAWQTLSVGAGGEMNNLAHADSDDTLLAAQNTYGAYRYITSGSILGADQGVWGTTRAAPGWQQLFTQTSAPLALSGVDNLQQGVNEVATCNNNTNNAYAVYNETLYSTTNVKANASLSWTSTGQTTTQTGNPGLVTWHGIICDPANPNIVYFSTPSAVKASGNGLNATPTFTTVTGIGTIGSVIDIMEFDQTPSAPTQTCTQYTGSPTCTKHLMIAVAGTGTYESYNGGSSFTATSGGPTTAPASQCESGPCWLLKGDQFGNFYLSNGDGKIHKYVPNGTAGGGTWSNLSPVTGSGNPIGVFAVDHTSSSAGTLRMVAAYADGNISVSTNGGSSWCTSSPMPFTASGSQPGWIANANQNQLTSNGVYAAVKDFVFLNNGDLLMAGGINVMRVASASVTCGATYVSDTVGIESLVGNHVDAPPGNPAVIASWDRAFYNITNPDVYPAHYWPDTRYSGSSTIQGVQGGWGLDCTSSNFCSGWAGTSANVPASSSDGGYTWAIWGTTAPGTTNTGGDAAVSTAANWIVVPAGNSSNLRFTTNGGSTFNAATLGSITGPITCNGCFQHGFHLAADRTNANTFCLIDNAGKFFASTNSGTTWANNGSASVASWNKYNDAFKSVWGQAGVFYYAGGNGGGSQTGFTLYKVTKTTNECDTVSTVNASIGNIYGMGYGAPKPGGNGFPTIYFYGAVSGVQGLYEIDNGSTTATLIIASSNAQTWPNNSGDFINDVSGDMNFYGRVYVAHNGSGYAYIDHQNACASVNWTTTYPPNASLTGTINLTAQSSGKVASTITSVSFYVDGSLIGSQTSGSSSGSPAVTTYTQSWNSGGVATGAHTLTVSAVNSNCPTPNQNYNSVTIPVTTH